MNEQVNNTIQLTAQELHTVLNTRMTHLSSYRTQLEAYVNYRKSGRLPAGYTTAPVMPNDRHVCHMLEAKKPAEQLARLAFDYYAEMFADIRRNTLELEALKDKPTPKMSTAPAAANTMTWNGEAWVHPMS